MYNSDLEVCNKEKKKRKRREDQHSPLRWVMVTFSRTGSSVISIPNRCLSSRWACSKTSLNCREPCSPSTLALMSLRRIGSREYSLEIARRTSFLTIASVLVGALGPSSSLSAVDGSDSSLCLLRRRALGVLVSGSGLDWGLMLAGFL